MITLTLKDHTGEDDKIIGDLEVKVEAADATPRERALINLAVEMIKETEKGIAGLLGGRTDTTTLYFDKPTTDTP